MLQQTCGLRLSHVGSGRIKAKQRICVVSFPHQGKDPRLRCCVHAGLPCINSLLVNYSSLILLKWPRQILDIHNNNIKWPLGKSSDMARGSFGRFLTELSDFPPSHRTRSSLSHSCLSINVLHPYRNCMGKPLQRSRV